MTVEILNDTDDQDETLELTDTIDADDGADTLTGAEPVDEIEYPDTLDEPLDPEQETPAMKHMREKAKQDYREKAALRREIEQLRTRKPIVRTEKPTLESCDYDEEKLLEEGIKWKENERAAEEAERVPPAPVDNHAEQRWQKALAAYRDEAVKLGKPDFQASQDRVVAALTDNQQRVIVKAAKHPARFIDALARSPVRLQQFAEMDDLIEMAAEVARIEGARTVVRKQPANIDEPVRGNARLSSAPKNEAEGKAVAAAEKSGDVNALLKVRREQRAKAA